MKKNTDYYKMPEEGQAMDVDQRELRVVWYLVMLLTS